MFHRQEIVRNAADRSSKMRTKNWARGFSPGDVIKSSFREGEDQSLTAVSSREDGRRGVQTLF